MKKMRRMLAGMTAALVLTLSVIGGSFDWKVLAAGVTTGEELQTALTGSTIDATKTKVTMGKSVLVSNPLSVTGGPLTLDLNGHTLTGDVTVSGTGSLTITNGTVEGELSVSSGTLNVNNSASSLSVSGTGVMKVTSGGFGDAEVTGGTLNVSGGTFSGDLSRREGGTVKLSGGSYNAYAGDIPLSSILENGKSAYITATNALVTDLTVTSYTTPFTVRTSTQSTPTTTKITASASNKSANLRGDYTAKGTVISGTSEAYFRYRLSGQSAWQTAFPKTPISAQTGTISAAVNGLSRGRTYEYQLVVDFGDIANTPDELSGIYTFTTGDTYYRDDDYYDRYYDYEDDYNSRYYYNSSSSTSDTGLGSNYLDMWKFWDDVQYKVQLAKEDGTQVVKVDAKAYNKIPSKVLQTLKGRNLWMTIDWSGGNTITIHGQNMAKLDGRVYYDLSTLAISYKNIKLPSQQPVQSYNLTYNYGTGAGTVTPKPAASSSKASSSQAPVSSSEAPKPPVPSSSAPALPPILQQTPSSSEASSQEEQQTQPMETLEPVEPAQKGLPVWALGAIVGVAFIVVSGVVLLILRKTGRI